MQDYDRNSFGLSDIGNLISTILNNRGNELSPEQRNQLQYQQERVEQLQNQNPQQAAQDKDGILDDIIRIAGPVLVGYGIRLLQERLMGGGSSSTPSPTTPTTPAAPPTPQYGTYQEGDVIHRSSSRGQSVEESD